MDGCYYVWLGCKPLPQKGYIIFYRLLVVMRHIPMQIHGIKKDREIYGHLEIWLGSGGLDMLMCCIKHLLKMDVSNHVKTCQNEELSSHAQISVKNRATSKWIVLLSGSHYVLRLCTILANQLEWLSRGSTSVWL